MTLRCWIRTSGQGWSMIRMYSAGNKLTAMERKTGCSSSPNSCTMCCTKFFKGHLTQDRTIALCQEIFYWPGMSADVVKWISKCTRCTCAKAPSLPHGAPLENIFTNQWRWLPLIILILEDGCGSVANVLVIMYHFSMYTVSTLTTNQTARTTANVFFDAFIVHNRSPTRIYSDHGRNFESKIFKELCIMAGMKKSCTTP